MRIAFGAILLGIPAFFLLPAIWPATLDAPPPSEGMGVARMLAALAASLVSGLGGVLIAHAFRQARRDAESVSRAATCMRLCAGWLLLTLRPLEVLTAHAAGLPETPVSLWLLRASVSAAALGAAWAGWSASRQRPRRTRAGA